jgi:hypothetical protein
MRFTRAKSTLFLKTSLLAGVACCVVLAIDMNAQEANAQTMAAAQPTVPAWTPAQDHSANDQQQVAQSSPGLPPAVEAPAAPPSAAACDENCVRGNADLAAQACVPLIEAQAPVDYDWLSRPFGGMFTQAERPGTDGVIRYRGDAIRVLTTDNRWLRHAYECGWDPIGHKVVAVQLRPGRLMTPAAVAQVLQNVFQRSQTQQAATQHAIQQAQAQAPVMPQKVAAPPQPVKLKPREPTRLSITQAHLKVRAIDSQVFVAQASTPKKKRD